MHGRYRLRPKLGRTVSPADMFRRLYSEAPDADSLTLYSYAIEG